MILDRLLAKGPAKTAARILLDGAVTQSRLPVFYARMGAPDTVEGRFEMLSLHAILVIDRLLGEQTGVEVRQALFDAFMGDLDGALREMGVGDLAIGKRMRVLAEAFYGRVRAYDRAFCLLPEGEELRGVVARTALQGDAGLDGAALATYVERCRAFLAEQPTASVVTGHARWPVP